MILKLNYCIYFHSSLLHATFKVSTYLTSLRHVLLLPVKQRQQITSLHPALPCSTTPSSSSCTWNPMSTFLSPDLVSRHSLVVLFHKRVKQQCHDFSMDFMQPLFSFIYPSKYSIFSSCTAAIILLCYLTSLHLHFISSMLATYQSDWQIHAGDHLTAQELRAVWDGKPQVSDSRCRRTDAAPAHTSPELQE